MIDEKQRFILFDIPEDETVDCSHSSQDSYLENPTAATEGNNKSSSKKNNDTTFLQKLSSKFRKSTSSNNGGADVVALRGIYGADFEGYAMVSQRRTNKRKSLLFLLGKNNNRNAPPKEQLFLLIKGDFCFAFKDELSPAPKYAILLSFTKARVLTTGDDDDEDTRTAVMETNEGELEFEFLRSAYANNFCAVANRMASQGEDIEEDQRLLLGNVQNLYRQPALVRYAEKTVMETQTIPNLAAGRRRLSTMRNSTVSHAA